MHTISKLQALRRRSGLPLPRTSAPAAHRLLQRAMAEPRAAAPAARPPRDAAADPRRDGDPVDIDLYA